MLVIHIFHVFAKLSTLKRFRLEAISALKHFRLCAETLPLSIYTYIYLYKKTCSWQLQTVDNKNNWIVNKFFIMKLFSLILMIIFLSACQKTIYIHEQQIKPLHVNESLPGMTHPAQFYICGDVQHPHVKSYKPSKFLTQPKRKQYEKFDYKQTCVK
jgi:hypothetical protein